MAHALGRAGRRSLDDDDTLYINVHVGGILRYDSAGVVPTLDIDADVHQVAAHPSQKGRFSQPPPMASPLQTMVTTSSSGPKVSTPATAELSPSWTVGSSCPPRPVRAHLVDVCIEATYGMGLSNQSPTVFRSGSTATSTPLVLWSMGARYSPGWATPCGRAMTPAIVGPRLPPICP